VGENFGFLETRDYDVVAPSASVTKAILSIPVTVDRNTSALRINEDGQLESVGSNIPRFNFDPVTFQPLGLLVEPAATNFVSGDMATVAWSKDKVALEEIDQTIGALIPVYSMQGDGLNGTHALVISLPQTSATQTISCYFRSGTNTLV
jgi:hypothetical protein